MAGQVRHLKVKGGRFYARIAVPAHLRQIIGKTELVAPLGGERRAAMKALPAAVTTLQRQIAAAEASATGDRQADPRDPITTADYGRAVWQRYTAALAEDDAARAAYPLQEVIDAERAKLMARLNSGAVPADPLAVLDASLELMHLREAATLAQSARRARLDALRADLTANRTHLVEHEIDAYLDQHSLTARPGSGERIALAKQIMRAEIEALQRTLERDQGDYGGKPADPIVKPPAGGAEALKPVKITALWSDYVKSRVSAGFMKDGGIRQRPVIENLRKFLGHNDARQITRRNLLDWRDKLIKTLSAKTTNDVYLSTVRSMLKWAHDEERLPENVAATVRQPKPKKQRARDPGYSDKEALAILKASQVYEAKPDAFGVVREKEQSVAAKRWVPLLCAFTGARVGEMLQLRKQDVLQEDGRWFVRVPPRLAR